MKHTAFVSRRYAIIGSQERYKDRCIITGKTKWLVTLDSYSISYLTNIRGI